MRTWVRHGGTAQQHSDVHTHDALLDRDRSVVLLVFMERLRPRERAGDGERLAPSLSWAAGVPVNS